MKKITHIFFIIVGIFLIFYGFIFQTSNDAPGVVAIAPLVIGIGFLMSIISFMRMIRKTPETQLEKNNINKLTEKTQRRIIAIPLIVIGVSILIGFFRGHDISFGALIFIPIALVFCIVGFILLF